MSDLVGRRVRWVNAVHLYPVEDWDCDCVRVGQEGVICGKNEFGDLLVDWCPDLVGPAKVGLFGLSQSVYSEDQVGRDFVLVDPVTHGG